MSRHEIKRQLYADQSHLYHISVKVLPDITLGIGIVTSFLNWSRKKKKIYLSHIHLLNSAHTLYIWKLLGTKFKMNSVQMGKQAGVCGFFSPG